jgi:hypothetical protein
MPDPERRVGRYVIDRQIGRGGMAIVYLARQETLDRDVALKELSSFHAGEPDMAQRFLRESRLAGSLNHPNVVTVYEYFEDNGIPYIAMEYVRRGSLRPYVGKLSMAQFVGVMEGVLAGLAHAETFGIVHRDLKPENLMVTADGRVKITDFGIAKATQSAGTGVFLTAAGTTVGTPTYMAPEQAMGGDIGIWTDLYSLGVMAWENVVGRVPFYDSDVPMAILTRQLNEEIPAAKELEPDVEQDLSDWIDRLLIKDPHRRARSPVAVWDELEEIVIARLGPRWRREARLPSPSQVFDTPKPLTPAPFESEHVRTPTPAAIPLQEPTAGPPVAEEAPAAPSTEGDYVTFGPAAEVVTPPGAAEAVTPLPAAAPDVLAPPPESSGQAAPEASVAATPDAPINDGASSAPPAAPEAPAAEPPLTPDARDPTYVTFGKAPGPVAPPVEEPAAPAVPDPAVPDHGGAPVEAAQPPEDQVAAAAPAEPGSVEEEATDGETLPGLRPWLGGTAASEETAPTAEAQTDESVAEARASREVEAERGSMPTPIREREGEPRRTAGGAVSARRWALVAGVLGVAAAAVIGFVLAPKSGKSAPPQPALVGSASSGPISVSLLAGWQRQQAASPPGLKLDNPIAVGPTAATGGELVIGTAQTTDPTLLPGTLLSALPAPPSREVVTLGGSQFYRYRGLEPRGASAPMSVYALPTSTAGTVLAACLPQGASPAFPADCERVLATMHLLGTSPAGLGPSSSLATELNTVVGKLNAAVRMGQTRLAAAKRPGQQATAASEIAAAYGQAAGALRKLNPPSTAFVAVQALAAALTKTGDGYTVLSSAASRSDGKAYDVARNDLGVDAGSVSAAFVELSKLGYTTG